MAGVVMRIVPKRTLDFTQVSSGTDQAQEIVLAQGIDVSAWREVALMVRAHSTVFGEAAGPVSVGTIEFYAYSEGRTGEDPGILFTSATKLGTVTIDSSTAAPAYFVESLGANIGDMVKIAARGTRISSHASNGNSIMADVSIDLSCKSA